MNATKKTNVKEEAKKTITFSEKEILNYLKYSNKSGIALKSSTVKSKGAYSVSSSKLNGTSLVLRSVLKELKSERVEAGKVKDYFSKLEVKKEIELITTISKELDKPYKNFRTLRNRLVKEINTGLITSFFIEK